MFRTKIKKKDILNDPSIKKISAENIDKDSDNIKVIVDIAPSRKKALLKLTAFLVTIAFIMFIAISGIILFLNTTIVQGNIEGSLFEIAGFSVVEKDYNPAQYLSVGKTIYYGSETTGVVLTNSSFKKAKVTKISNNHVSLAGDFKDTVININEVDYILKENE